MPDPVVFSVQADGGNEVAEGYGYNTSVIRAYTSLEQRAQLRAVARESIAFSIFCTSPREAQLAASLIYGGQAAVLGVPLWQYGSLLTGDVAIGASLLPIADALSVPYKALGYAIIWRDAFTWELFNVTSTSGSGVATSDTSAALWTARSAYVYPVRLARLANRQSLGKPSSKLSTARVEFHMEATV